jgi:glucose/arabinose dehydrogenase
MTKPTTEANAVRSTALILLLGVAATLSAGVPLPPDLEIPVVVSGLSSPVGVTNAGDGSDRIFVVERAGRIRVVENGVLLATPYLDITGIVNSGGGEQGLLGLAFDPDYATNGDFYVHYTRGDNANVVAHYNADPPTSNVAGTTGTVLLTQSQPRTNHNGGQLAFGPDGYLYISIGDGGKQGDPDDNAQNLETFLGKILRIAVDGSSPYTVPADNPYVGMANTLPEIWQPGLRNPWRFSFDRLNGDLFIGDVGQNTWEEINHAPAPSAGGENWGWRCYEATHEYNTTGCGPSTDYVMPILEYSHSSGRCSVTGGYRYRGDLAPGLRGAYLYADWCSGDVWAGVYDDGAGTWSAISLDFPGSTTGITSFGEDEQGNVHFVRSGSLHVFRQIGIIFDDGFESGNTGAWSSTTP